MQQKFQELAGFINRGRNKRERKIAHRTIVRLTESGEVIIKYWNTDILTFKSTGAIIIKTDGWRTVTTKRRINEYISHTGKGIHQKNGIWLWEDNREFVDGEEIL